MITTKYFLKGNDPNKPFINVEKVVEGVTISVSNPPRPGDVEITEAQYNQQIQVNDTAIEQAFQARQQARRASRQVKENNRAAAKTKLVALGLTEDEVDALELP